MENQTENQAEFDLRCEWGEPGVQQLVAVSSVVVIVDVLSFSTCVDIAAAQGASIYPYRWKDESAVTYAASIPAQLASLHRDPERPSLSPGSLRTLTPGSRLVLPSPNGSNLSLQTGTILTIAACLRNAEAVARFLQPYRSGIAVIPAGERWPDGSLRFALEDWIGAGAILRGLAGRLSPEAAAAVAAFQVHQDRLPFALQQCSSGKELLDRGFATDVELAAQLNVSNTVPRLMEGAFRR